MHLEDYKKQADRLTKENGEKYVVTKNQRCYNIYLQKKAVGKIIYVPND